MLKSPTHVAIGATDLARTAAFFEPFGFRGGRGATLPAPAAAALYGLEEAAAELELRVPGAERGWIRLVSTPLPPLPGAPLDNRPFAVDLFTTEMERSLEVASQAGFETSPVAEHRFGPLVIREVEVRGPDHLVLTLLESAARRPTLLDSEPGRLHSEVHALVWSVQEIDRLLPFWLEAAGQVKLTDATFESAGLGALLGVPDRALRARLVVFADPEARPLRLEMIEFLGEPAADLPDAPLRGGYLIPAFEVDDLERAAGALEGAEGGEIVELDTPLHAGARALTALAPGGLRFELWQTS